MEILLKNCEKQLMVYILQTMLFVWRMSLLHGMYFINNGCDGRSLLFDFDRENTEIYFLLGKISLFSIFSLIWRILFSTVYSIISGYFIFFVIGWIIRYILAIISFVMAMCLSERARQERKLFIYLPLKIFYTGYFLRITRLIAHTIEICFFSSYKDPWNPKKTSELAQIDRI